MVSWLPPPLPPRAWRSARSCAPKKSGGCRGRSVPSTTLRSRSATSASARPRRSSRRSTRPSCPATSGPCTRTSGSPRRSTREFRAKIPQGEKFCVTVIMARPGRGAPLHAHTTEEIFIALTAGGGASSGGRRSARCDPGAVGRRLGAVDARPPQRQPRMRSCSASSAVATPTADLPPVRHPARGCRPSSAPATSTGRPFTSGQIITAQALEAHPGVVVVVTHKDTRERPRRPEGGAAAGGLTGDRRGRGGARPAGPGRPGGPVRLGL